MTVFDPARRRARTAALALGCTAALAGGGALVAGTAVAAKHARTSPKAQVEAVLLRAEVASQAYSAVIYANGPSLAYRKSAAAKLQAMLSSWAGSFAKLTLPKASQAARGQLLSDLGDVSKALSAVKSASDASAYQAALGKLTPAATKAQAADNQFRGREGLTAITADKWFAPAAHGPVVYRDDLSRHHGKINWVMGNNVQYKNGGLSVAAAAGGSGMTGPSTPFSFDGSHITVEVDAAVTGGQPFYGVLCPKPQGANTWLTGLIAPNGGWAVGTLGGEAGGFKLAGGSSKVVKPGQTNHIRVDCEQFSVGLATAKIYVDGKFLGESSAPIGLGKSGEAGLAVISTGAPATVLYKHWSVEQSAH